MKRIGIAIAFFFLTATLAGPVYSAGDSDADERECYAEKLPSFSLKDPAGKTHTQRSISKNGVVLVVTAPIMSEGKAQDAWDKRLTETKSGSKAKLVFLEDMKPSAFKGKAKKEMAKEYEADKEPLLLIDENGQTRQALKVPEKETVVLVYDKEGTLVYSETGAPNAEAAAVIWEKAGD